MFAFISTSYNICYKFVFTSDCLLCKILLAALDILICLTFLCVRNLHILCNLTTRCLMALSVSITNKKNSLVFQNYNSNKTLEFMFLHYQKLNLNIFKHKCKMYFGTVFCCLHCVLHLFCTGYQYLYWDFCTVIHSHCPVFDL